MNTCVEEPLALIKEVAILRQVIHPNIVAIMGICHDEFEFHIITELVDGYSKQIKICDFGIAKVKSLLNSQLTTTRGKNNIVGTLLYM